MYKDEIDYSELANSALGTCMSIDELLLQYNIEDVDTLEVEQEIENNDIFRCSQCGWWVEQCDLSEKHTDEHVCIDCEDN